MENPFGLDLDDAEDLVGALLELRAQLRNLQWYGEVNKRGFVKITKKLNKRLPQIDQKSYVKTKVDILPFATNASLLELVDTTNDWLAKLGDIKTKDDSSSTHSIQSLPRVSIKSINLPQGMLDTVEKAVKSDDVSTLMQILREANTDAEADVEAPQQKVVVNLLQRAISCKSRACIAELLANADNIDEPDDINQRNILHRFLISLSRSRQNGSIVAPEVALEESITGANFITPATAPNLLTASKPTQDRRNVTSLTVEDGPLQLFEYILDNMGSEQRSALQAKDSLGRMPLHYAAQHGYTSMTKTIISRMQTWNQFEILSGIDAPFWQDTDGWSPLGLAVLGGHTRTVQVLLEAEEWRGTELSTSSVSKHMGRSGEALLLAVKEDLVEIVKLLVTAHVNLDFQDAQGETALHIAARYGHELCCNLLLSGTHGRKASTEVIEQTFGWTPLHVASVDGSFEIVKMLIMAGADPGRTDHSGWTAKEHAALRGHITIARELALHTSDTPLLSKSRSVSPSAADSLTESKSSSSTSIAARMVEPVKSFGHRYLKGETLILVSLGTMDTRKNVDAVSLDQIPLADAHSTQLDTALSLIVSASGASGEALIVDLPVEDNISTSPVSFYTKDSSKVKILFDLVPTYAGSKDQVVGRAVAMLSTIKPGLGSKRITLQGDITVPVLGAKSLEVIGSVNFNFLIIKPFQHPNMTINENYTYWKSMASPTLIGHRGLGKNVSARTSLQLGENTLQSFIAAANLGANYVEFDVQLTKDLVPVIYHDFLVSETGIDAPVHTLTVEQFLHINNSRSRQDSRAPSPERQLPIQARALRGDPRKQRSASLSNVGEVSGEDLNERMKHTRAFKEKGFTGNSRGNFIQAPFTTLEEMFHKIPESTGFNIEMKYPMLFESEEQEMDTYAVELNSFVDTVLEMVYDFGNKRNIIFSSFNPDICLLLSFKQPSIPILFLTDAGASAAGDIRASSLQEAIRFASRWNLLGVVSAAEPLVLCPRLVRVVKESGLVCVTYGNLNNDPRNVSVSRTLLGELDQHDANNV